MYARKTFCVLLLFCVFDVKALQASVDERLKQLEEKLNIQQVIIQEQGKRIQFLEDMTDHCQTKQEEFLVEKDRKINDLSINVARLQTKMDIMENQLKTDALKDPVVLDSGTKYNRISNVGHDRRLLLGSPASPTLSRPYAFYAYFSHHELNPGNHHTLIFDLVKTNTDGAYSGITGIYTVPVDGIYGFTYSVRMSGHTTSTLAAFELLRNNFVEGTIFIDSASLGLQETVTGNAIIHADAGDKIFVRTHASHPVDSNIWSDTSGRTTFTGWLIYEDE